MERPLQRWYSPISSPSRVCASYRSLLVAPPRARKLLPRLGARRGVGEVEAARMLDCLRGVPPAARPLGLAGVLRLPLLALCALCRPLLPVVAA